jgi:Tfp pilus assembly protein PilF
LFSVDHAIALEKGHGGGGHGNHGGGNGRTYLNISPNGIGIGYQNGNFGIQVGPVGGYGYGGYGGYGYGGFGGGYYNDYYASPGYYANPGYYSTPNVYSSPTYYPPVVQPMVVNPSVIVEQPLYPVAPPLPSNVTNYPAPADSQVVPTNPVPNAANDRSIIEVNEDASRFQVQAERAFKAHDYNEAVRIVNHALLEDGENGKLHLFASQCYFATGDFRGAAIGIAQAMSLLEEQDWGYVVQDYEQFYDNDDYVSQMDRLVQFNRENPEAGYALMLRGYHYLYLGHKDAAAQQFSKAIKIDPGDEIAKKLLALTGVKSTLPTPAPTPAE